MVRPHIPQSYKGSVEANTLFPPQGRLGGAVDILAHILTEDNFFVLTEDGFEVLLEDSP